MRVGVIGAGLAGLTAARALADAGLSPVVLDKGRGVGGRLSTRRADGGLQFDHGAQYLTAKGPEFSAFLEQLRADGAASAWDTEGPKGRTVGLPGMSGIAKHLADGLDVRTGIEVKALAQDAGAWRVGDMIFDRVICTVPPPQAAALLGPDHPLTSDLAGVRMLPNLTLMLAFPEGHDAPFVTRRDADDAIAWLSLDSDKPGREAAQCWVAQASLGFSVEHLELDKPQIAEEMLPLVCARIGAAPGEPMYVSAHRWRYAMVDAPLGKPFLASDGLFCGGDWALSQRAEGAWLSGRAMAQAVLDSR